MSVLLPLLERFLRDPRQASVAMGLALLGGALAYLLLCPLLDLLVARVVAPLLARDLASPEKPAKERLQAVTRGARRVGRWLLVVGIVIGVLEYLGVSSASMLGSLAASALVRIAGVFLVLRFFLNNIVGRIVVPLLTRDLGPNGQERAQRIQTLVGVVRSTAYYVLAFIMVIMALNEFGVNTAPVLASASVLGLAVGFGSQKLVRDVTTGFLMLAENQYDVGDYVTIGAVTGVVQEVGMRTTRIRDDAGRLFILSNGDVSQVCNHSAGLMSMSLDVPVAATTELPHARAAVDAVGERIEAEFGAGVLERPHIEGLTAMSAAQITLRIRYRAVVTLQERVQMRLRELIRERFAEDGIPLV